MIIGDGLESLGNISQLNLSLRFVEGSTSGSGGIDEACLPILTWYTWLNYSSSREEGVMKVSSFLAETTSSGKEYYESTTRLLKKCFLTSVRTWDFLSFSEWPRRVFCENWKNVWG